MPANELAKWVCALVNKKAGIPFPKKAVIAIAGQCFFFTLWNALTINGINEMKAINRQIKLISEIDKALLRIKDDTYGYCLDTAEPIGLKRLMARPVAKYTIAAQEKHEKNEKVYAED